MKNILTALLLFIFSSIVYADTVYLKNGRSIDGIVKSDNGKTVELEVGSGTVKFLRDEIESILRGSKDDSLALRGKWEKEKLEVQDKIAKQQLEEERKPRSVEFSHSLQGIVVNVLLNGKIEAKMVLDTGASVMLITKNIADKLKIKFNDAPSEVSVQVADGRQVNAKSVIIDKVEVQGIEAKNVEAAVLLEESANFGFGDGLLGMSFLKRFNFKVDQKEKELILEKL